MAPCPPESKSYEPRFTGWAERHGWLVRGGFTFILLSCANAFKLKSVDFCVEIVTMSGVVSVVH